MVNKMIVDVTESADPGSVTSFVQLTQ